MIIKHNVMFTQACEHACVNITLCFIIIIAIICVINCKHILSLNLCAYRHAKYINYEKAFDSVQTQAVLASLQEQGIDLYVNRVSTTTIISVILLLIGSSLYFCELSYT